MKEQQGMDPKEVRWLAELVLAQITSERNRTLGEYIGYSDRPWMQSAVVTLDAKKARVQAILDSIPKEAAE